MASGLIADVCLSTTEKGDRLCHVRKSTRLDETVATILPRSVFARTMKLFTRETVVAEARLYTKIHVAARDTVKTQVKSSCPDIGAPSRMTALLKAIVLILSTRRLTHLIVDDEITRLARQKAYRANNYWLSYLISCSRCVSVWAGLVLLLLSKKSLGSLLVNTLALSEASILVDELLEQPLDLMDIDNIDGAAS